MDSLPILHTLLSMIPSMEPSCTTNFWTEALFSVKWVVEAVSREHFSICNWSSLFENYLFIAMGTIVGRFYEHNGTFISSFNTSYVIQGNTDQSLWLIRIWILLCIGCSNVHWWKVSHYTRKDITIHKVIQRDQLTLKLIYSWTFIDNYWQLQVSMTGFIIQLSNESWIIKPVIDTWSCQ